MSNNRRRHKKQQHSPRLVSHSSQEQETDALDHELIAAYTRLSAEIERAKSIAPHHDMIDLSGAARILSEHPQLVRYLDGVREREYARESGLARLETMTRSSAPTNSMPHTAGTHSGWTGSSASTKNVAQGVPNARVLRDWADSNEWVRAAINARRQQIERADIAVVPLDERKPYNRQVMKSLQQLLDQPNELRDSWRSLIGPVIEDILVLDRGVLSKSMTPARKPSALYYEDGATIKIYPAWSGNPDEPRYLYEDPNSTVKVPLRNDEAIVMIANSASYRYGLSPVQVLRATIIADLDATRSAAQMVAMKPPPAAIQMPGASEPQLRSFMSNYDSNIAGRKELFVFGGPNPAHLFPLVFSAKDNQWMEWQEYLARKICALFQISPQQIGLTFDINKATATVQQNIFEDTGLIPLLLLLEEYLNRELLGDFAPRMSGDRSNLDALNLRIMYPEVSEAARQMHEEKIMNMASIGLSGLPSMTINQVLLAKGEEPVRGGNTFYTNTKEGPMPWLSYDGEIGDYSPLGTLGTQDPAGGIDDAENVPTTSDESSGHGEPPNLSDAPENASQSSAGSKDTPPAQQTAPAEKRFVPQFQRDTRRPGTRWQPTQKVQATFDAVKAQRTPQHSDDEDKARQVLHDAVTKVFADAAKRGKLHLKEGA